jgi:hypothetical protein
MTGQKLVMRNSIIWTSTMGLRGVITCDPQRKAEGIRAPAQLGGTTGKKIVAIMNAPEKSGSSAG